MENVYIYTRAIHVCVYINIYIYIHIYMCVCIFYILCKKYICKNLIDSSALLTAFEGTSGVREGGTEGVTAESAMAPPECTNG